MRQGAGRGRGGVFRCHVCDFTMQFASFGRKPSFNNRVVYMEDVYCAKDPSTPWDREGGPLPIVLGSHCTVCAEPVCSSPDCSLFYAARFCKGCIISKGLVDLLPPELKPELTRILKVKD